MSQEHVKPLTTLRFLAAFWVVLFHTRHGAYLAFAARQIEFGYVAVSFFFLLSGFVLGLAYLHRVNRVTNTNFFLARFARIYPLFFVTACLDTPYLLLSRIVRYGHTAAFAKTVVTFAASVLMLKAWLPQIFMGIDDPNWSLAVETVFYLSFPFLVRRLWPANLHRDVVSLVVVYLAACLLVVAAIHMHLNQKVTMYNPLLHMGSFVEGILLCRIYIAWAAHKDRRFSLRRLAPLLAIAGLLLFVAEAHLLPTLLLHDGALAPAFMLLILAFSAGHPVFEQLFSNSFLVLLGEASYGLYLWHFVIWHWTFGELTTVPKSAWSYSAFLVGSVALSVASYLWLEKPARTWILARARQRSTETPVVASLAE